MRFEKEVQVRYSQAHALAKKSVRMAEKSGIEVYPRELKYDMFDTKVDRVEELGTIEIPVDSIIGTAVFNEKGLYSPDFMPIASEDSPFAEQWCQLYMDYLKDYGWYGPIRCIEYLGRFYVQDGKKRVSVLKAHGAYTTQAIVTRLLPVKSEEEAVQRYYSFLENYKKTGLYQAEFTNPDGLAKIQQAFGHGEDDVWNDQDRFSFLFNLLTVEYAMHRAFPGEAMISAVDTLVMLLEEYTYWEIRRMKPAELTGALQKIWMKLQKSQVKEYEDAAVETVKKAS